MKLDESQAAAIAAWAQLDSRVSDRLLRAVAGAFAIIACADGNLDSTEVDAFMRLVRGNDRFAKLDLDGLEGSFRALCQAVMTDYEDGRRRALEAVAAVRSDPAERDLVLAASQLAIVADGKLQHAEETIFAALCGALGVDPAHH